MAKTSSIRFPNMIDPARNIVNVVEDNASIINRTQLLLLTEPTELYNEPEFGVGLKRYIWQYNGEAVRGMLQDRIRKQIGLWEPCVDAQATEFVDGLLFTEGNISTPIQDISDLKLTIGLKTRFGDEVPLNVSERFS